MIVQTFFRRSVHHMTLHDAPLNQFAQSLKRGDIVDWLRAGVIGDGTPLHGPLGTVPLVYADYVASGRALEAVEQFVMRQVLPYYANSHTEASFCGAAMTQMRHAARDTIARLTGADDSYAVIFGGSGATFWLNRLIYLFDVPQHIARGERVVIFIGPYEHHSNILPWRECGAEVIEIAEAPTGGPDLCALEAALKASQGAALRIGAFSAASNVTGVITNPDPVTKLLNAYDVRSVWDYAGGGPYLPIDMKPGTDCAKDAVVVSPHKFLGGPGASGVLIIRKDRVMREKPAFPGGGTVRFVSPTRQDYVDNLAAREEAGTPNVIGDIRSALAFLVKDAIGQGTMEARHAQFKERAQSVWGQNPNLELLGVEKEERLPIFSFRVRDGRGGYVHHQLFTRMLSDLYGIQARGGCACAGPYAHRLLDIDTTQSEALREKIFAGDELAKPGWVRLNFSVLLDDAKAQHIIDSVDELARHPERAHDHYTCDMTHARFSARVADELA